MDAYYYSFDATGEETVDRVLSAVACAGKAYHHTEEWSDEAYSGSAPKGHAGKTCVEWIQNAANDAAKALATARAEGMRQGFDLAVDHADISTNDEWQDCAPFNDWTAARKELEAAILALSPPGGEG
jgi:hypothetical protein